MFETTYYITILSDRSLFNDCLHLTWPDPSNLADMTVLKCLKI